MTKKKKPEMPPPGACDDISLSRRRVLTRGVIGGLTLPVLPAEWSRPIIQTVLLPAHAQTSPQTSSSGNIRSVALPACSVSCSDDADLVGLRFIRHHAYINGNGDLVVDEDVGFDSDTNLVIRCGFSVSTDRIEVVLLNVEDEETGVSYDCDSFGGCGPVPEIGPDSFTLPIDIPGVQAQVSFQLALTCDDDDVTLSISNIVVSLV